MGISKHSFKIKKKILIEPEMYYSDAFKSLSASALRTLMRCLQKRVWEKKKVNGKKRIVYTDEGFIFPYFEAKFLCIGTTQFWKNMKILIERGFIDVVHQGGWYQKNEREKDYSVYKLSGRWKQYGTPYFEKAEKQKVLQPSYYIRKNLEKQKTKATSQKRSCHLHDDEVVEAKHDNNRLHDSEVDRKHQKSQGRLANAM